MRKMRFLPVMALALAAQQPERKVDPTFLRRQVHDVQSKSNDFTTDSCQYKPLFGAGDPETSVVRGVARFGELTVAPGGACKAVDTPSEEQVYVVAEGSGVLHYG